ncbi:hypothetical protein BG004_004572 [Podila humilis]|nr:hypothetical protein BG004_004572 [Podila humilis]
MSAFGPGGGASGAQAMNAVNVNNTGNAFGNHSSYNNNLNYLNWNASGAGDNGTAQRGSSNDSRGGRGGSNRGSSNMSFIPPGANAGHNNQQHNLHHPNSYQHRGRGRGGSGDRGASSTRYVTNARGSPGQFRSIQYRPHNNSVALEGQNSYMGDSDKYSSAMPMDKDFGSELPSQQQLQEGHKMWSGLSSPNPRSSTSVFGAPKSTFPSTSGLVPSTSSLFGTSTNVAGSAISTMFGQTGPRVSTINTATAASTPMFGSSLPFVSQPTGSAFKPTQSGTSFRNGQTSTSMDADMPTSTFQNRDHTSTIRSIPQANDPNTPENAESRLERFSAKPIGNRYEELKEARVKERDQAIRSGAIPDPDKQMRLEDAITFVGTCTDMCPEFERHEREYQKNVESFEKSTLDYLINEIVAKGDDLHSSHAFVRDRTRSIRQDFTLQNSRGMEAIEAHEIIARYHILCAHQLCEVENFSLQQEVEQLEKVLTSLKEFYEDKRAEGILCPNEAEFQAYLMLSRLRNPDMLRHAQNLPRHILQNPHIQAAADIHILARQYSDIERQHDDVASRKRLQSKPSPNFYSRLFKKIAGPGTTYLMACLMETHFARIRKGALKAMNKGYMTAPVPSIDVVNALGFDDVSECIANCELYDLEVANDSERSIVFNRRTPSNMRIFNERPLMKQHRNVRIVEAKRQNYSDTQIIYGETPGPSTRPAATLKAASRPVFEHAPVAPKTGPVAPSTIQPQPGMFDFGITPSVKTTSSTAVSLSNPSTSSPSSFATIFAPNEGKAPFSFGISVPPQQLNKAVAGALGLGVSSFLNPATMPFKPAAPSPLKPPLSIPPSTTSTLFAVPPSQQPAVFNFAMPATAPQQHHQKSGRPQLTVAQHAPTFSFNAPAVQSSPPTVRSEELRFDTSITNKASSGFTGTISTSATSSFITTISATPAVNPPPSPISTPKTNALTIVSRRGRIYPRSVVESVVLEIIQEEVARITRQTAAQVVHDTSVERSLKRAEERKHAIRIEELRILDGLMDDVISDMVRDVRSEIQREIKLQRWVIGQWKEYTVRSRERAAELQRRKDHYLKHVRAMNSRAGLGDDEKAIKIREYKDTQMRCKPSSVKNGHDEDSMVRYRKGGLGGVRNIEGIKAMAEQVNRKKRRIDDVELDEVGYGSRDAIRYSSRDDALLEILKKAAEPLHQMWAPVAIQEIVENKFKETHSPGEGTTHPWRLYVNTPDFSDNTSKWLLTKLGTDMGRGTKVLQRTGNMVTVHRRPQANGIDVAVHGIVDDALTDLLVVPRRIILQTSALMFAFSKVPFADGQATESAIHAYWKNERDRLVRFLACFPGVKQPLVFVMWGEQSIWEKISPDVVELLGLVDILRADRSGLSTYRFVVMDIDNMHLDRYIAGSLEWLATETRQVY